MEIAQVGPVSDFIYTLAGARQLPSNTTTIDLQ